MHSASINPLARLAEHSGKALHKSSWKWSWVHAQGHDLSSAEIAGYQQYQSDMWRCINRTGSYEQDLAISAVLPPGPWRQTAVHFVAQMLGGDADETSAWDTCNYSDGEGDWLVEGGLGAFVGNLHKDVPVQCNCPVSSIDYSGPKVRVTTPRGTLEANHVVLTVSTGVLAAETIEFTPALPGTKLAAIDMLPNGLLNKIGIEFDPLWKEAVHNEIADYHSGDAEYCTVFFGFYGSSLATGFVAGRFADALERHGQGAATEYCLEGLRKIFGNDIQKSILRTSETAWRSNANTLGSYSFARPGASAGRELLAEPLEDRLFFAGEATMKHSYSTVHGAFLSGQSAAEKILSLRRMNKHRSLSVAEVI